MADHALAGRNRARESVANGMAGFVSRNRRIGCRAVAAIAEARVWAGMLRRAVVGVDHVARRASAGAIIAGLVVRAGQRKQRIEQARFLQAEKNGIGAQLGAESALAELVVGRPASSSRSGLPISPFFSPPRSNTRRTLPGCEISQRSSGVISGRMPFVRVSSGVGAGMVRIACGCRRRNSFRRSACPCAGRRRCCRAPRPTACRRASSCWLKLSALPRRGNRLLPQVSGATRKSPGLTKRT